MSLILLARSREIQKLVQAQNPHHSKRYFRACRTSPVTMRTDNFLLQLQRKWHQETYIYRTPLTLWNGTCDVELQSGLRQITCVNMAYITNDLTLLHWAATSTNPQRYAWRMPRSSWDLPNKKKKRIDEGDQCYPKIISETVYLSSNILHIDVNINECEARASVDSGAFVSIINKNKTKASNTYAGKHMLVQSYDGKKTFYEEWKISSLASRVRVWKFWLWSLMEWNMSFYYPAGHEETEIEYLLEWWSDSW